MSYSTILWDMDDDPEGNVKHCADHGITPDEVEDAFENVVGTDVSRSTGRPVIFGDTRTGKHIIVIYEEVDADTAYPVSAFEVPRRQ